MGRSFEVTYKDTLFLSGGGGGGSGGGGGGGGGGGSAGGSKALIYSFAFVFIY